MLGKTSNNLMKSQKNKKIIFDDDGETTTVSEPDNKKSNRSIKKSNQNRAKANIESDIINRWYEEYAEYNVSENTTDLVELKDAEIRELSNICRVCFQAEESSFLKKNPSDAKWLETALHKGTSKDRANAGSLLVQSNPVGNIKALETLISLTKISNKSSTDAVDIITQLFISGLLPSNRKLLSIQLRGADWKALHKNNDLNKSIKDKIYAYWQYESLLKEQYFEFLRNVQTAIQGTQDSKKNQAIVCAARLLTYAPEMEQMLLSMLVNKLGDPSNKVASKALHHLSEVAYRHPAMCDVIIKETEKLLFRNNITEHAQHFALCFLSQIASRANSDVCVRLVNICFSFFKIVVQKGAVNSKTMQAILRCLKRAIVDANPTNKDNFLTKDMEDTMYRLLHLADIHITLQTFALLLQIISVSISNGSVNDSSSSYNRYYNALYKKMLDLNLTNVGPKSAAQFLHIIHRSIYVDANVARAQAFVKRLLQAAFYLPVQMACGCLIVINKLIRMRPEIAVKRTKDMEIIEEPSDDDDDNNKNEKMKYKPVKYDGFHRIPSYAGAETALNTELLRLNQHYHPTVQIFAQNIIDRKNINFYGDPLRDFSLTQFLERFSFRNPRKIDDETKKQELPESMVRAVHHRPYTPFGGRGLPVKHLTKQNCTEDERFIFQYLEQKRAKQAALMEAKKNENIEDDDDVESVNDDEFDAYLDGLGGKDKDDELDFMNDLGEDIKKTENGKKKRKKAKVNSDDDDVEGAGDWDENIEDDEEEPNVKKSMMKKKMNDEDDDEFGSDDEGSISLDEDNDGDDSDESNIFEDDSDADNNENDSEDESPPAKKLKPLSGKEFRRSLKNTDDMSSLFAAVDDFSEMLEDSGNASKTHGTLADICNKDRASEKQLDWETNRSKSNGGFKRGFKKNKNFQKKFQPSRKNKR